MRSAPCFEPDPIQGVLGPSLAGNLQKTQNKKLQILLPILSEDKSMVLPVTGPGFRARFWDAFGRKPNTSGPGPKTGPGSQAGGPEALGRGRF